MASPEVGRLRGEDLFHSSSSPPSPHLHNHFSTRNAHESEPHSDLFATTRQEQMPPFSFCVSSQGQPYYEDTSPPFLSKQQEPTSTSTNTTTSKSTHAPPFCTNLHLMGNNNNTNPPLSSSSSSSSSTHMHLMDNSKINPSPLSSSSSSFSTYMHLMGNSKVCSPPLTSSSCTHMHLMGDSKVHPPPLSSFSSSPSSFPFSSSISGCHTPDRRTKTMSVKEEDYESGRMVGKSQSMRLLNAYREENEMLRRALFYSLRRAQEEEEEEEEELPIPPPSIFGHSSNIFSDPFQGRTKSMMEVGRWGHVGSSSSLESHFVPPPWMNPYPLEEPKIFNHHHLSSPSSNPHSGFFNNMGNYSNTTNNPYILGEYSSSPSYGEHQANLYSSSSPLGSRRKKKKKKKEVEIASPHTMMLNMKKTPPTTTNVGGRVDAIVSREDRGARYSTSIDKLDKLSKRDFDNPQQETYLQGLEEEGQCVMCGNRLFFVGGSREEQTQGGLPLKLCSSCHPHPHPHPRHNIPLNPSKPTHLSSTHHLNNKGQVGRSSSSTTMPSRTPHPPTSISISMACMPSASSSSTSSGSLYGKKKKAGFLDLCKHFLGLTTTIKT